MAEKPIPCPRGAMYHPIVRMPRTPPKPRELSAEERAAQIAARERAYAAAGAEQVKLLAAGMEDWLARARRKWLQAGGYGFELSPGDEQAIRDAGFEPAPLDRPRR